MISIVKLVEKCHANCLYFSPNYSFATEAERAAWKSYLSYLIKNGIEDEGNPQAAMAYELSLQGKENASHKLLESIRYTQDIT